MCSECHRDVAHTLQLHVVRALGGTDECAGEAAPADAVDGASAEDQGTLQSMRGVYEQLSTCFSSEQADEIAINFCFVQTKSTCMHRSRHHY